jgi:hypothetical protein
MGAGEPGWYEDPGGQPGLRWWDGSTWGSELRPPGPAAGTGRPAAPARPATSTETRATFDPPRFDMSPGSLFQPPRPAPPSPRRSPLLWVGLAVAAVILVAGVALISSSHDSGTPQAVVNNITTSTVAPGATVAPGDSLYTDTGSLYTMATGANWKVGLPGISNSATWTVAIDPTNTAKVQVLPSKLDAPQTALGLAQSDAQELDPLGTRSDAGALYLVDGTGADQLKDGSQAGIIHLHTNPLDPDNAGANLVGAALVTSKGNTGAMVLMLCPAAVAPSCLSALLPYARTIQLTSS